MQFGYHATPSALAHAVKAVWFARGTKSEFDVAEPIVPDGCVEIVFNLADPFMQARADGRLTRQPVDLLAGQMTRPTIALPSGNVDLLGVRFWPGRAGAVLRTPVWELQDQLVSASSAWSGADRLIDELRELDHDQRIEHLARALAPRCAAVDAHSLRVVESALSQISRRRGQVAIEQLAKDAGVSRRHLERQFREQVGLRAKHVARIVRIQSVLELIRLQPSLTGADVAAECGYSDQAHLIHECKALTGSTPARLVSTEPSLSVLMREIQR
jgi:AraC-like DNA-binding protein